MTYPVGTTPDGAYDGTGGFADYAATTQSEWETSIEAQESAPWGSSGLLGALFEGLTSGKPFVVALIEAIIASVFEGVASFAEDVGEALLDLGANFSGKWYDVDSAKGAAAYANAQLAAADKLIKDLFDAAAGDISANWDVTTLSFGGGSVGVDGNGNAYWDAFGGIDRGERCRWNADVTATDSQLITIVKPTRVQAPLIGSGTWNRILARVNETSSINTFVYAEIGFGYVEVGCFVGGSQTVFDSDTLTTADGDTWDFTCGSPTDDYQFILYRNGVVVLDVTDSGMVSTKGSGYRAVGFELFATARVALISQTSPGTIAVFSADDATWGS